MTGIVCLLDAINLFALCLCGSSGEMNWKSILMDSSCVCLITVSASLRSCRTLTVLSLLFEIQQFPPCQLRAAWLFWHSKLNFQLLSGSWVFFSPTEDLLKCHSECRHCPFIFPLFLLINILMSLFCCRSVKVSLESHKKRSECSSDYFTFRFSNCNSSLIKMRLISAQMMHTVNSVWHQASSQTAHGHL